jgi:hypothetical protein
MAGWNEQQKEVYNYYQVICELSDSIPNSPIRQSRWSQTDPLTCKDCKKLVNLVFLILEYPNNRYICYHCVLNQFGGG